MGWKGKVGKLRTRFGKGLVDLLSERVEQLFIEGNFSQALQEVEELSENKENFELADQLRLDVLKSRCIFFFKNYQEARSLMNGVIEQGKTNPTLSDIVVDAYIQKAWVEHYLGHTKEGMESVEMGEMLIASSIKQDTPDNKRRRGDLLRIKGVLLSNKQLELTLEYAHQAYSLFEEIGDKSRMAATLVGIGGLHDALGKSDSVFACYKQAKRLYQEVGNRRKLADVEIGFGAYYTHRGEHDEAMACTKRALMIFQMYDDKSRISGAITLIGRIYLALGELNSASDHFEKSILHFQEIGDEQGLAYIYFLIGRVFTKP